MSDSEELERRIADLEARQELLKDVMFALADAVNLEDANFACLALLCGFTAEQLQALHEFYGWAIKRRSDEQTAPPLTREEVLRELEARMPQPLQGKLEMLMHAHRDDGNFHTLARVVLEGTGAQK